MNSRGSPQRPAKKVEPPRLAAERLKAEPGAEGYGGIALGVGNQQRSVESGGCVCGKPHRVHHQRRAQASVLPAGVDTEPGHQDRRHRRSPGPEPPAGLASLYLEGAEAVAADHLVVEGGDRNAYATGSSLSRGVVSQPPVQGRLAAAEARQVVPVAIEAFDANCAHDLEVCH